MPGRALAAQEPLPRHVPVESPLLAAEREKQQSQQAQSRKFGRSAPGDRSNASAPIIPASRVTDHRINLTLYTLDDVMNGNLDD